MGRSMMWGIWTRRCWIEEEEEEEERGGLKGRMRHGGVWICVNRMDSRWFVGTNNGWNQ